MQDQTQLHHQFDDLHQIQSILDRITSDAGTHGVYLVDDSGFLIAEAGDIELDRTALAALIAASFAATSEIAKLLGEDTFTQLTQQAVNRHMFISKAGKRHIVIAVFGRETNLGLVKLYVEKAVVHLGVLLDYEPPALTGNAEETDLLSQVLIPDATSTKEANLPVSEDTDIMEYFDDILEEEEPVEESVDKESDSKHESDLAHDTAEEPVCKTSDVEEDLIESIIIDEEKEGITEPVPVTEELIEDIENLETDEIIEKVFTDEEYLNKESIIEEEPAEKSIIEEEVLFRNMKDEAAEADETMDEFDEDDFLDEIAEVEEITDELIEADIIDEKLEPEIRRITEALKEEMAQLIEQSEELKAELSLKEDDEKDPDTEEPTPEEDDIGEKTVAEDRKIADETYDDIIDKAAEIVDQEEIISTVEEITDDIEIAATDDKTPEVEDAPATDEEIPEVEDVFATDEDILEVEDVVATDEETIEIEEEVVGSDIKVETLEVEQDKESEEKTLIKKKNPPIKKVSSLIG
ncbi:MAG: roadblock/LC7 domain-containing protein [Candidatus Hatepunaea meridiana]|nr:roadblock/LC7 domain-containing protein [Candidatus Hatepunaea meridiana]